MRLELAGVRVEIDATPLVREARLVVEPGEIVGLVGPNGCGKSSLLRTVYRALRPVAGTIRLDDDDVWALTARQSALRTAVVVQEHHGEFDFAVDEVVALGRNPHKGMFDRDTNADHLVVAACLERVGMTAFAHRVFTTLSGGEKQKVLLARALAQRTALLVLDEPTNHLDVKAQLELLELVRELKVTTLTALHELNLAAAYCDRIYVMSAGRVVAGGSADDVLTPELLREVFEVNAHRGIHPATGRLHLAFTPLTAPLHQ